MIGGKALIFETYSIITPNNENCKEYNDFYRFYGLNIKYNIIFNDMIHELKGRLPYLSIEIQDRIKKQYEKIDTKLYMMGIERVKSPRDNFDLSISNNDFEIRKQYFNNDYDRFINYITDFYQVIQLYANFESTVKAFIFRKKQSEFYIKQRELFENLFDVILEKNLINRFNKVHGLNLDKNNIISLWNYYTNIRNLYAHSGGILGKNFINDMTRIKDDMSKLESKLAKKYSIILEKDIFLNTDNISEGNLYIISEYELRIFRNFIVYIWESIYLLETENENKRLDELLLIDNTYDFNFLSDPSAQEVLNEIPESITTRLTNIYVSGYVCPICKKNNVFLYKTLFNREISVNEIFGEVNNSEFKTEKAFTCVECKSIFFPKSKKMLSDNLGMNIINLNDEMYSKCLEKLNDVGDNKKTNF